MTTFHEMQEALREMDPDSLQEMAYQLAASHVSVCQLTSREGDCAHIDPDEIRDRVNGLSVERLAELLAPTAWVAADMHERMAR